MGGGAGDEKMKLWRSRMLSFLSASVVRILVNNINKMVGLSAIPRDTLSPSQVVKLLKGNLLIIL